jgi:uncharacterized protein YoaH (UPF0181 family)
MSFIDWLKIIAEILRLIAEGMSKNDAVSAAAKKFGVSEGSIWKRGGF